MRLRRSPGCIMNDLTLTCVSACFSIKGVDGVYLGFHKVSWNRLHRSVNIKSVT